MSDKAIFERIKKATVAIVAVHENTTPKQPFTIFGSGFCIHPKGIIVTCEHVFKAFIDPIAYQQFMQQVGNKADIAMEMKSVRPHALFHHESSGSQIRMPVVPIVHGTTKTNFDLAGLKLLPHAAFPDGFPSVQIADYHELHEMMEIGLCGYPLGNFLHEQLGTVTSSFAKGVISSIIPTQNVPLEQLRGFQLNLTATNGNSGGPVFSLATGHVFGVLQRAVVHPDGFIVQGITKAEPIYPILEHDLLNRLIEAKSADYFKPPAINP